VTPTAHSLTNVEDLYLQYSSYVYRLALRSTHNHAESEDIVQEVFLRISQKWGCFRGDSQVKTWIGRIARNYIADAARKKMRHQKLIENVHESYHSKVSLDTLVEFEDMLNLLPQQQRRVFNLRIMKDLSVSDTAKILGCSEVKVRVDTHRALTRLKKSAREACSELYTCSSKATPLG
jgi:RNA polymerase sigma-70 factor, ECF subfamily